MGTKADKCASAPNHRWFGLSLQALVVLSQNCSNCPSAEIASKVNSEASLIRKILAMLAKGGLLESREGREGGYRLKNSAEAITLAEVYTVLQLGEPVCSGMLETTSCHPFGVEMNTIFGDITAEIDARIMDVLGKYTIADLAARIS
ncbi:Rrf2 family transcriptional regulator [Paenibacillaceae bacterium]|nr:Rrf2 family transcriptional regulator [Paenibacillaceae bacterium]